MKKILLLVPILCVGMVVWDGIQTLRNHAPVSAYGTHLPQSMQSRYRYRYHGTEHEFTYLSEPTGVRLSVDPDSATGMPDLAQPGDIKRGRVIVVVASDN